MNAKTREQKFKFLSTMNPHNMCPKRSVHVIKKNKKKNAEKNEKHHFS